MAADAETEVIETLTDWAWNLGMVFQLSDDALDLVANEAILGKPAGSDIREGTFTLPVLAAIAAPDGEKLRLLLDRPRPYPEEIVTKAIEHLRNGGWVEQAIDAALAHGEGPGVVGFAARCSRPPNPERPRQLSDRPRRSGALGALDLREVRYLRLGFAGSLDSGFQIVLGLGSVTFHRHHHAEFDLRGDRRIGNGMAQSGSHS